MSSGWTGTRFHVSSKKAASLPPLSASLLPAKAGDVLERDELWSFVGSKLHPRWVWIALCHQTCQVVACFVGDRSTDSDYNSLFLSLPWGGKHVAPEPCI